MIEPEIKSNEYTTVKRYPINRFNREPMNLIPITVECHSGYKVAEFPRCFYLANVKVQIKEISDRWYHAHPSQDGPIADYFKVIAAGNMNYIIKHELISDEWFLVTLDEPIIRFSYN